MYLYILKFCQFTSMFPGDFAFFFLINENKIYFLIIGK